jgi:hypothetical protein
MGLRWPPPDPRLGMAIEVVGGDTGYERNIVIIGQRLPREGFAAEDPPPPFDQIEPGGSYRNEGVLDPRMGLQPFPDRPARMAGQVVGNQVEVPARVRAVQRLEQLQIATGVACASGLGQRLSVSDAQRSLHPHLRRSPVVIERNLNPVSIR